MAAHGLLRIATAGSVDDGKSTLIGRLLHDTKTVMEDHLAAAERASQRYGAAAHLALLTDGLRAEREQGITIDVAYRFFATPARSFIVADTPGHVQYTRNMVTGASTADVAVVLVDARNGLVEQSRRHAYVAALLGVRHVVLAVNKMDLVGWDEETFHLVAKEFSEYVSTVRDDVEIAAIPLSALHGDNVVSRSDAADWYDGPSLLEHLEHVDLAPGVEPVGARLAVQWVVRPQTDEHHDYRGYAGRLVGAPVQAGDEVTVLPAGHRSHVARVEVGGRAVAVAVPGQAVIIHLAHDLDVSRGDTLATGTPPLVGDELVADLCWMAEAPLTPGARVVVKHGTRTTKGIVTEFVHVLDVNSLEPRADPDRFDLNDLGRVRIRTAVPLVADPYDRLRETGAMVLIDEATNATAGAAMVRGLP